MFIQSLQTKLEEYNLLNHPFYQRWSCGELELGELKFYGAQYYHHVEAFPRYISTIHSKCADIKDRQVLLGNLKEEEEGEENHPELWLRFTDALGVTRTEVKNARLTSETKALVDGYYEICNSSYAAGVGALYAYEQQVPGVAKSKIDGLKKFYNINSEDGLKFFNVHLTADEWHSQECAGLLEKLPEHEKPKAVQGAVEAAKLLWEFLDGVEKLKLESQRLDQVS